MLLHAIVPAEFGAADDGLVRIDEDGISAFASTADVDMLEHHRIVERLHQGFSACLPARFGTRLTEGVLRELLQQRRVELEQALARVRGRSELAVTAVWTTQEPQQPVPAEGTPGRAYLRRRQRELAAADAQRAQASAVAEQVERELAPLAVDTLRTLAPRPGVAVSLAVLVERGEIEAARQRIAGGSKRDDVRILVNGPWPPYSFARLGMGEE
jgi:Gas vesicle synthesis protein GvpL/GvpF